MIKNTDILKTITLQFLQSHFHMLYLKPQSQFVLFLALEQNSSMIQLEQKLYVPQLSNASSASAPLSLLTAVNTEKMIGQFTADKRLIKAFYLTFLMNE